jgi:hypothetical protein
MAALPLFAYLKTIHRPQRLRIDLAPFRPEYGRIPILERGSMRDVWAIIALAAAFACTGRVAFAEETAPANTLVDLQRQFGACMKGKPAGPAGSRLTMMLMMKRDGSIFGKPRITFSHLEGDKEARQTFINDVNRAVETCLPFRITPSLGGAIAGRPFVLTFGRPKAEQGI